MKWNPTLWFLQFRGFWRARVFWQRGAFLLNRRIWKTRAAEETYKDDARLLGQFFRLTFGQLLFAILASLALQAVELVLVPYVVSLRGGWPLPDAAIYTSWLLTLAQIGGVFLALYFTALTAAAAAIYSQVPEHIRNLLAEEPVGNVYIKLLTFTTFTPLCLVALTNLGLQPLRTAVPALLLSAGVGIMAFAKLGQRAFDLFSVMRLSRSAFANFERAVVRAQVGSFRWRDPSFQNHAHKQGASALRDLATFAEICSRAETLKGTPLLDLAVGIIRELNLYQYHKKSIPTSSFWYQQQFRHKEWYQTPDWALTVAQQMGTSLTPEQVVNQWWVEEELEAVCLSVLRTHLADSRSDLAVQLLHASHSYVTRLATNGDTARAIKFCDSLISTCQEFQQQVSSAGGLAAEQLSRVAIAERLAALFTSTLVAFTNGLASRNVETSRQRLVKTHILQKGSIYKQGFVVLELQRLEPLVRRLSFERVAEGHEITPLWYVLSMLAQANVNIITSATTELTSAAPTTFGRLHRLFQANPWAGAAVLATELEFWSRFMNHNIGVIVHSYADQGTARVLTDINWPAMEEAPLRETASKARSGVIRRVAQSLPRLFATDRPDGVPDYRGQFSDAIAQSVFQAIVENRSDTLPNIFAPFFAASFFLFDQLKPTEIRNDIWAEQKMQIAAAPILDIAELSGYSKLASEIFRNQSLWTPVEQVWDSFLISSPTGLRWLSAIIGYGEPRFALAHRSLIRTTWQMRIRDLFAGIVRGRTSPFGPRLSDVEVDHDSPLVRVCARDSFADGIDIFVDTFLRQKPEAEGLDWGQHSLARLDRKLKRESARNSTKGVIDEEE